MKASTSIVLDAGELIAYVAMKAALEDIRDLRDKRPWEADVDKAADIAKEALATEERMSGGAGG